MNNEPIYKKDKKNEKEIREDLGKAYPFRGSAYFDILYSMLDGRLEIISEDFAYKDNTRVFDLFHNIVSRENAVNVRIASDVLHKIYRNISFPYRDGKRNVLGYRSHDLPLMPDAFRPKMYSIADNHSEENGLKVLTLEEAANKFLDLSALIKSLPEGTFIHPVIGGGDLRTRIVYQTEEGLKKFMHDRIIEKEPHINVTVRVDVSHLFF